MVAAYLSAIVTVRMALIISRFFLSPKDPASRFLPISNAIARFLYRWIAAISIFASFGLLTCGIIKLIGASEAVHVKAVLMVALLITGMLIVMILQKRKEVAATLSARFPAESHPAKLMRKWHHFAIFFVLLFLILSMSNTLLGKFSGGLSIKTLLMIPFYFLMDWILCQISVHTSYRCHDHSFVNGYQHWPDDCRCRGHWTGHRFRLPDFGEGHSFGCVFSD